MRRFLQFLTNKRTLIVIGFLALAIFLLLAADTLQIALQWAFIIFAVLLLIGGGVVLYRYYRTRSNSQKFNDMLEGQAEQSDKKLASVSRDEAEVIRKRMLAAISTIKNSKLGETSGATALYELPWYMIIGNPAAGKSSAIANSGLQFPLADSNGGIIQGIGGTRNCDWFFTTDGILLDTAGRYSVYEEDRAEWFSFLGLLKKYRRRAPINGIIIAVSIAELINNRPEFGINLAKNLRQRVQELTEKLEVFAPVYIMFTKADLITGFNEFFHDIDRSEIDRVWGATFPYNPQNTSEDVLTHFDEHFDKLYNGLKEISLVNMSMHRGDRLPPGILTFPLEFANIRDPLRAFIATLFEENPFQFKPVFRGFYFTSALQEGNATSMSSERVAQQFGLKLQPLEQFETTSKQGVFLLNLFRKVIFADKNLVTQYASRNKIRLRYAMFFAATAMVGLALGGWSWSYMGNKQLTENVQADLDKVVKLQESRLDLQSRFESLEILQDRIEQLQKYNHSRPLSLSFGLYQGDVLEAKLLEEYFAGVKDIMVKPVTINVEAFLAEMNAEPSQLTPMNRAPQLISTSASAGNPPQSVTTTAASALTGTQQYKDASPTNVEDGYNALKTYLMLGDRTRAESSHLNDQVSRFWRGWLESNRGTMPREQLIRSAERIMTFYLSQISDPSWPTIEPKLSLVEKSRDTLRRVVRGMAARDRVYADIKARASTRFPPVTVARIVGDQDKELLAGSYAIPGTFTREAWEGFVQDAFKEAANKDLQSSDWVLKTASNDDLTLEGSPEQIQKVLVTQYKTEYAKEWQKFVQGVSVIEISNFDNAVKAMNRFGDPSTSPINKFVETVYDETSWDNPSLVNAGLMKAQSGFVAWFKQTILRRSPSGVNVNIDATGKDGAIPMGPVGKEFAGVARLIIKRDNNASLMRGYMEMLSKLRTRFNQIKNQGDTGPGANQLMQQTLSGSGSELADALKYVDEQMLTGMTDTQKQAIRPVLVRPLIQAFAVTIRPTEAEMNKIWRAQVYEPFQSTLAPKYPFAADSKVEATTAEIGQIFGPEGAIAKYVNTTMGPLILRRGDLLAPKTWADMGIELSPSLVSNFSRWAGGLGANGAAGGGSGNEAQTLFQIQALPAAGTQEYTIEIDGQQLRYRNTQSQWTNFVWPNSQGTPGATIKAVTFDGRTIEIANQPGRFGLERLINTATRTRKPGGNFELSWTAENITVPIMLKIISSPQVTGKTSDNGQGFRGMKLPETIAGKAAPQMTAPVQTTVEGAVQ